MGTDWSCSAGPICHEIDQLRYFEERGGDAIRVSKHKVHCRVYETLGMDDTQQMWKWADVGSCQMPRSPPMYPTLKVGESGARQPAASQVHHSQVHHKTLFQWIVGNLSWLSQYDTVYVFVDNRALSGANPLDYWPFFAPWIKSRCEIIGPYQEKTTAVYIPINSRVTLGPVPQSSWSFNFFDRVEGCLCAWFCGLHISVRVVRIVRRHCIPPEMFCKRASTTAMLSERYGILAGMSTPATGTLQ